jgi:hypothetical protein
MTPKQTAERLLSLGFWPVAIYPGQKRPIGLEWGLRQWSREFIQGTWENQPEAGVGLCLGPGRGPGGGWLIDLEGDGPEAAESMSILFHGQSIFTASWRSARGLHSVFLADGERLLGALARAGAKEEGGAPGVWHLAALPGLEFRVGGFKADGTVKQLQSVAPPTKGDDGRPREWIREPW